MKAVAVTEPGRVEIVELPLPQIKEYEVLVRTEISFICNATDRKVIDGRFPGLGRENYPLILGHESVGRVEAVGPGVRNFKIGDRTVGGLMLQPPAEGYGSGWGGHSEYVIVSDDRAMKADGADKEELGWNDSLQIMQTVPEDISLEAAGLLCTWREVYAGMFSDFSLKQGDDLIVFGAGPVGLSFIKFAKLKGLGQVVSVDPLPQKREKALAMGADAAVAPDSREWEALLRDRRGTFDAVVDAVGHENVINAALPMVRMGGKICVYGVLGSSAVTLQKDRGPYNFNLLIHQWPTRDAEAAAQAPLIEWIRQGRLEAGDFVTGRFPLEEFPEAVEAVKRPDSIKTMLIFGRGGAS